MAGIFTNGVYSNGFDFFTTPAQVLTGTGGTISNGNSRYAAVTGAVQSKGIGFASGSNGIAFGTSQASFVIGFAYKVSALPAATNCVCQFATGTNRNLMLFLNNTGTFRFAVSTNNTSYGGNFFTLLGTASTIAITGNTWNYLEIKATIGSSGLAQLRLNGTIVTTFNGDTRGQGSESFANVWQIGTSSSETPSYDDVYMLDLTGAAPLNDYLGDSRVNTFIPIADSAAGASLNQFSTQPSQTVTNHYQNVDEVPADDNTSYNFDATAGERESYRFAGISGFAPYFVNAWARPEKDDASSRSMAITAYSNGATIVGTTISSPSSYAYFNYPFTLDPNTSAAWTTTGYGTGTNSRAEFGLKIIS